MDTNSSRFGLRGTESLGGGLNAIFQVESSINPAQSGGTLAGRESFVGLQGGWGTFKMGRFLTPYDDIHPIFGNVPDADDVDPVDGFAVGAGLPADEHRRLRRPRRNSVRYDTPNMSGFTASFQYGAQGTNYAQPGTPNITPTTRRMRACSARTRCTTTARSRWVSATKATTAFAARRLCRAPTRALRDRATRQAAQRLRVLGRGRVQLQHRAHRRGVRAPEVRHAARRAAT